MKALSQNQYNAFARDGVVFPIPVLDRDAALELIPRFQTLEQRMRPWTGRPQLLKAHIVSAWVAELVHHAQLLDAVEDLIGPNILCWGATFFAKPASSRGYVGWHQDLTYWGLTPADRIVTAWLGLSDAKIDNGCMRAMCGSHDASRQHLSDATTANMLNSGQEVTLTAAEQAAAIDVELEPGQASIHHSMTLHGSSPNTSTRPRIGLSINYIAADVTQRLNNGVDAATLVRGSAEQSAMILERHPTGEFEAEAIDQWRETITMPSGLGSTADGVNLTASLDAVR